MDELQLPHRRQVLSLLGGLTTIAVIGGCGDSNETQTPAASTSGTAPTTTAAAGTAPPATAPATSAPAATTAAPSTCTTIPRETVGPFPGDGTNGPNVLTQPGVVRRDIRSSFGSSTRQLSGVPLNVNLKVVDTRNGCRAMPGAAVYIWHCDAVGNYSMYSSGVTNENFLRGVQEADANGSLSFLTVFPGAYNGRYPHIHFEIFPNLGAATNGRNMLTVSQLALPDDACKAVYATSGYTASQTNYPRTPISRDNVFNDGWDHQMAAVSGSAASGYTATLTIGV